METITESFNNLCKVIDFPKDWEYDDIVVYALNFAFNNADAINDDFIVLEECEHENKTYQAKEWDTNVPESYTCDECGKEFDIPEPSFEDEVMEDEYEDE